MYQQYWQDYQLTWDPANYGNIDSIRIKPEKIWVPDFVLFNNADGNYEVTYKSNCVLYSSSHVNWIPPAIYHSSCSIDVMYFPFDQQVCEMKFGSWTHKGNAIKYSFFSNMNKLDLTDYLKSGSWDIIDCPGKIVTIKDEITGDVKDQIVFEFVLRRKTLFYTVNLIIPCVLISFVSICVFALPADAGEKITLCISVLLALVVFLLLVSKILPPSLTIPLIAKYLLFTFIMNLIAIFSTVVIINRNYRTPRTHNMPYWVRVVFLRELPRFLFIKRPDHMQRWQEKTFTPPPSFFSTPEPRRVNIPFGRSNDLLELREVHHPHCRLSSFNHKEERGGGQGSSSSSRGVGDPYNSRPAQVPEDYIRGGMGEGGGGGSESLEFRMTPEIHKTVEAVKFIYLHLKQEKEYETMLEDWKYVARVLDRLLLIVFLLVTLVGTAGILLNAPHILEFVDQDKIIQNVMDYISKAKNQHLSTA
ncbi:Acetylcholine receptor subunit beta-like 1 [Bulinus truncatus]|nr:Acetylcholine receptor subunit beta-like 1 [Bulinus truncatus]